MTNDEKRKRIHDITYSTDDREELAERMVVLEELVMYMWDFSCVVPDEPHTSKEEIDYSAEVWKRMRELGLKVKP